MSTIIGHFLVFLFLFTEVLLATPEKPLVVGTTSGYAPYVSLNEKGEYEGFDIDVANALAKKLNRKLEIKDFGSMPGLMMALNQGKIDLLIWAVSITEKRKEKIDMIHYQGKTIDSMPFIFWKSVPEGIASIEDLAKNPNWVIACEAGTSQEDLLRKFPTMNVKTMDKITDVILDLKFGKSFGAPVDVALLPIYQEKFPELKVLPLKMPESEVAFGVGVCVSKTNSDLSRQVRGAIEDLKKDGTIGELEKKWNIEG